MKTTDDRLTTARLVLRRFTADDIDMLDRLNSNPDVTRYTGGVKTREQSQSMLQTRILDYYQQHPGLGIWVTELRDSGTSVGLHLLNHIQGEDLIQVGYMLLPEYWGRGYATEMSIAILRYAFEQQQLAEVFAITNRDNLDSQKVLLKAGMQRRGEREFLHPAYAAQSPLAFFCAEAASWTR